MFGIINVNKPKGITSHDVISRLRKILKMKKIGHTGTLDPMAIGVLPVCIGKSTRLIQYLEDSKAYRAYIKLGIKTDTYDIEGQILESNSVNVDFSQLDNVLNDFRGEITQRPPIYSAIHYKGKRLYEYARNNEEIEEIPLRKVTINSIELVDILEKNSSNPIVIIDVDCSSGTYIRSISNDIGEKLGCGATLIDLTRTRAGKFKIENSYTLENIADFAQKNEINKILIDPVCILDLKCCKINNVEFEKIQKGQYINVNDGDFVELEKVQLINEDNLIGISEFRENKLYPILVFNGVS